MANFTQKRPDIDHQEVARLYRCGYTIPDLAERFDCSTRTIWNRLHKAGEFIVPQGVTKRYPLQDPSIHRKQQRAWKARNRERVRVVDRAAYVVKRAIEKGILVRPDLCENCGIPSPYPIQAAHENYHFPLLVRWLCTNCHAIFDSDTPKSTRFRPALEGA